MADGAARPLLGSMEFGFEFEDGLFDQSDAVGLSTARADRILAGRKAASSYAAKIEDPGVSTAFRCPAPRSHGHSGSTRRTRALRARQLARRSCTRFRISTCSRRTLR